MEWSPSKSKRTINLWKQENSKNSKKGVREERNRKRWQRVENTTACYLQKRSQFN
jgi:hypothetical protein